MQGATLEELRELSRRSRRTLGWGILATTTSLLLLPATLLVAERRPVLTPGWAVLAVLVGGGLFLRFAHVAGQERGAYRRLFREARARALARTLAPEAPAVPAAAVPMARREE